MTLSKRSASKGPYGNLAQERWPNLCAFYSILRYTIPMTIQPRVGSSESYLETMELSGQVVELVCDAIRAHRGGADDDASRRSAQRLSLATQDGSGSIDLQMHPDDGGALPISGVWDTLSKQPAYTSLVMRLAATVQLASGNTTVEYKCYSVCEPWDHRDLAVIVRQTSTTTPPFERPLTRSERAKLGSVAAIARVAWYGATAEGLRGLAGYFADGADELQTIRRRGTVLEQAKPVLGEKVRLNAPQAKDLRNLLVSVGLRGSTTV